MSSSSAPSSFPQGPSPALSPIKPTLAEKPHAFRTRASDSTSSPYLAFILVDLFFCLGYLTITVTLLYYAAIVSIWLSAYSAFSLVCAILYAARVKEKWDARRDALIMRKRGREENQLLERTWDRERDAEGEEEKAVGIEEEMRDMMEV